MSSDPFEYDIDFNTRKRCHKKWKKRNNNNIYNTSDNSYIRVSQS